ncbi:MAG: GGDEF domain-containing protein [Lachnospiraceae bacterium]|nr:GGDEF domain-containing protein [Lachnospiraceae bacterium]
MEPRHLKIAVITASMHVEYTSITLKGIEEEAKRRGVDIYIFNANTTPDEKIQHNIGEYNIYKLINYKMFDGVIFFANLILGAHACEMLIEDIRRSGLPAVSIDREIEGFYFLGVDNYNPVKEIVSHLIEVHGYKKIFNLAGQDFNSDSVERLNAYKDAMEEHGLKVTDDMIFKGAFTNAHGRDAARQILENPDNMPRAIVCGCDTIGIGARTVFEKVGIRMPEDIAFAGFDDIFEAGNSIPRMTTVSRNLDVVGRESVKRIIQIIKGENPPKSERFPATVVYRESCGCVPKESIDVGLVRKNYLETSEEYGFHVYENNTMVEELTDCKTFGEFLTKLGGHIGKIFEGKFFLCLDKEFVKELNSFNSDDDTFYDKYLTEGYPDLMTVVAAYEYGELISVPDFSTRRMLPDIGDEYKFHNYIFSPVHFRNKVMGYIITDNCKFPLSSPLYTAWIINLSNCLESLAKQNHLKNIVDHLDKMYVVDPLTGLYNRYGFERFSEKGFDYSKRYGRSVMVLFVDMDGLKYINDHFGHNEGDKAIKAVATALKNSCMGMEVCSRYGGDEFVVFADKYNEDDAKAYKDRFEKKLAEENLDLDGFDVSASLGYIIAKPSSGDKLSRYVELADNCMYAQKIKKKEKNI